MATDVEKLIVALEARTKAFENALNKANGVANKRATAIERRFQAMNRNLSSGFNAAARAFAIIGGAAGAKNLVDTATRIDNALKVAGLSGEELERVYGRLRDSALANAAPLESLVTLYGRAAIVQKELGISTDELLGFTNNVAVALRVAGTDAQSASGALLQLSQALGSGVVRAEEFNSILEGALPFAQAAAAGLKEAGGSVAKLRQLVVDGAVSSEAFFRAFEAGSVVLEDKVANATLTIDQRLVNLQTSLVDAARRFNESAQASATFGAEIDRVAAFVNSIDFDNLISEISAVIAAMNSGIKSANDFANAVGNMKGWDNVGKLLTGGAARREFLGGALTVTSTAGITDRINEAFEDEIQKAGELTSEAIKNSVLGKGALTTPKDGRVPAAATVAPVSLADFDLPASKSKGKGKGKGGGGRSRADSFQREVEQIQERTAAIQAETAAMAGLNPLIDDFGYSIEFARSKQDLLNAAQKAGVEITPQVQASIEAMARGYAEATSAAERLDQSQRQAREASEFFADSAYDAFSDLIPQIETGNKALDKFLNTLIEAVAQSILLGKGPLAGLGGGGGFLGGLFSIFGFANGGIAARGRPLKQFASGGISRTAAIFGEAGPEAAVPLPDGRRIPVDLRMSTGKGLGGGRDEVTIYLQDDSGRMAEIADQRIETKSGTIVNVAVARADARAPAAVAKYQAQRAGGDYRNS
ncbi:tape measure domain-containing protein [Mycoplana sp. BE70]|uniref:tape measure protein n=1 Tax=Mycoplana sp. BE70 TaxID=2817775 RepID=UPI00285F8B37|nr:tape measure protein [Mycoplana sp. BE70]MDR6757842.1 tape measure domain-containing protein [Mycoplana sp. BE70]